MAINYPDSLDVLVNPNGTDGLSSPSHSEQHSNANDAIEALQAKVGIDGSLDSNSLDFRVSSLEEGGGALGVELGLAGNNDLTIEGIENETQIDSFTKSVYRTIKYNLQVSRGSEFYSSEITVLNDGTNINVSESDIISNTDNNMFNYTFEENSGIIGLNITPVSTAVTARYFRTALKA
jgi:hypothetical protein